MKYFPAAILLSLFILDWFHLLDSLDLWWSEYGYWILSAVCIIFFLSLHGPFTKICILFLLLWAGQKLYLVFKLAPSSGYLAKCHTLEEGEWEEILFGSDLPPVKRRVVDKMILYRIPEIKSTLARKLLYRRFATVIRHQEGDIYIIVPQYKFRFEADYGFLGYLTRTTPIYEIGQTNGRPLRVLARDASSNRLCE